MQDRTSTNVILVAAATGALAGVTTSVIINRIKGHNEEKKLNQIKSKLREIASEDHPLSLEGKMQKLASVAELQTECLESVSENNNPASKFGVGASLAAVALWYHGNYSTSYSSKEGLTVTERPPSPCVIL